MQPHSSTVLKHAGKMAGNSNTREGKTIMVPKTEDLDYELPPYTTFSGNVGVCC